MYRQYRRKHPIINGDNLKSHTVHCASCILFLEAYFVTLWFMEITYLGHSSFLIRTQKATLVTDPFDSSIGISFPTVSTDIVTVSHGHSDHNNSAAVGGNPIVFDLPGEYEKQEVRITGIPTYHDKNQGKLRGKNTMFKIDAEGISILHCGDLGHALDNELQEEIGTVDILMVPCGGTHTISAEEATKITRDIGPLLVIPMHFSHKKLDQERFGELTPVDDFLAKLGAMGAEPVKKLKISASELEGENMKVVVMEP